MAAITVFTSAWRKLSLLGQLGPDAQAHSHDVVTKWKAAGRPADVDGFIKSALAELRRKDQPKETNKKTKGE